MRDLLERWAAIEPERCHEVEYGDGTAIAVVVEGETLYADSPGRVKVDQAMSRAVILAATIEAIEDKGLGWALVRANGLEGITGVVEGGDIRQHAVADTPAEALLTAYLAAIEAEAGS